MHKSARIAYHVIYVLCSSPTTCGPAMRYLRSSADFLFTQVQHLPSASDGAVPRVSLLSQLSWLLKATAIELRLTSMNKQRSHAQRLIQLFLSSAPPGGALPPSDGGDADASSLAATEAFSRSRMGFATTTASVGGDGNQLRPKLLQILDAVDFCLEIPPPPDLNMFDLGALEKVIKSCQVQLESGLILCDVKNLHEILLNEVNAGFAQLPSQTVVDGKGGGGGGYPQPPRQQIKGEIQLLLDHVVAQNRAKEYLHSQQQAFEAWRQVTEILLTACSLETNGIRGQSKNSIILLVLQHLTSKILDAKSAPELVSPAAGVILTLVANLRQSILEEVAALSFSATTAKAGASRDERTMLDRTAVRNPLGGAGGLSQGLFANLGISVSQLLVVLKGLIQTVLKPGGTLPNERANLYGALLNYLHIADVPSPLAKNGASAMDIEKLCLENANAINGFGDHFLEMVARDACDAHHVSKMLALSLLDAMVAIDKQNVIVHFLANKGYLQHLVDSLLQDDPLLQTLLTPNGAKPAAAAKALYIYEAKLALLIRMATVSTAGATAVLHSAILDRLACCKFLDMRPDSMPIQDDASAAEVANFRTLLFPALKLSLALLTSLGRQVASKLMLMIAAHAETFHAVLRERHATWEIVHVDEMNLVTAVLAKSSIYASEGTFIGDETLTPEFLSQLGWIERQMLNILPRFFLSAQLQSNLRSSENLGGTSQLHLGVLKVASNILAYCSSIAHSGGAVPRLVFAPTFNETASDISSAYVNRGKNPSLALPLLHLQTYASLFLSTSDHLQRLQRKREAVQDLRADELQELSSDVTLADEKIPAGRRQQVVAKRLDEIIETVDEQRGLLLSIMENLVFLLWRHLDVYLMRCSPVDVDSSVYLPRQQFPLRPSTSMARDANPIPESQTNLTVNELNALKSEVAASLGNDGLFRKLAEIEQIHAKSNNRFSFLLAMVRRLKRFQKLHTDTNIC